MVVRLYLLFLSLAFFSSASNTKDFIIWGPSYAKSLFDSLSTAFSYSHGKNVNYQPILAGEAEALLDDGNVVMVESLENFTSSIVIGESRAETVEIFALYGFPLVVVFNLDGDVADLSLSQEVLVDIFLGRITKWNDERLVKLNPDILFPNQTITRVLGTFIEELAKGLSKISNEKDKVDVSMLRNGSIFVGDEVSARVSITECSIGFSYMADALINHVHFARIENKEGFFASPLNGAASSIAGYHATLFLARDIPSVAQDLSPHNVGGRLAYPFMGHLYMLLPRDISPCTKLQVVQDFVTLAISNQEALQLAQILGWEPMVFALSLIDSKLGTITNSYSYQESLHKISCDKRELSEFSHSVGATSKVWSLVLKLLVAYSQFNPLLVLASVDLNISNYLTRVVEGEGSIGADIDVVMTWSPVLSAFSGLHNVPVFMGALVPVLNLGVVSSGNSSSLEIPNPLILSPEILIAIFAGEITVWNNERIQKLNPDRTLQNKSIHVLAAPQGQPDGQTAIFAQWLQSVNSSFVWEEHVEFSVNNEDLLLEMVTNLPFSISYSFAHVLEGKKDILETSRLWGSTNVPLTLSDSSLRACWTSVTHPDCWPLVVPLSLAYIDTLEDSSSVTCRHQKESVDFVDWVLKNPAPLDDYLISDPNAQNTKIQGTAAFCGGRSLVQTIPEPQTLDAAAKTTVYAFCTIGLIASFLHVTSLAVARNRSELKSASVAFSLLASFGVFMMFIAPILVMQDDVNLLHCQFAVWNLSFGFTACFGALFCKLYRLYKIFTSRSLIVPRLSNKKLFLIVTVFFILDFILLMSYSVATPSNPEVFSSFIVSEADLVSGKRELTWRLCAFHPTSGAFVVLLFIKTLMVLCGTFMAFTLRKVDRRFAAVSALGLIFYNLFIMFAVVSVFLSFVKKFSNVAVVLYVPVYCGIWILFVTLVALVVDSNVMHACRDFSLPLRRLLSKDFKERAKNQRKGGSQDEDGSNHNKDNNNNSPMKESQNASVFVINREMFPVKYDDFSDELLAQILDELTYQRHAVRRALVPTKGDVALATGTIDPSDISERQRGSTKGETPTPTKYRSRNKSFTVSNDDSTIKTWAQQQQLLNVDSSENPSSMNNDASLRSTAKVIPEGESEDNSNRPPKEARPFANDNEDTPDNSVRRQKILTEARPNVSSSVSGENLETPTHYQRLIAAAAAAAATSTVEDTLPSSNRVVSPLEVNSPSSAQDDASSAPVSPSSESVSPLSETISPSSQDVSSSSSSSSSGSASPSNDVASSSSEPTPSNQANIATVVSSTETATTTKIPITTTAAAQNDTTAVSSEAALTSSSNEVPNTTTTSKNASLEDAQ